MEQSDMNRLKAGLLSVWLRVTSWLPLPLAHALGSLLGLLWWLLDRRQRRIIETNLRLCFPEQSPSERARGVRRSFVETGKQLLELGILWNAGPERLRRLVRNRDSVDRTYAGLRRTDRGLLLAAPHLGAWELVNRYLSLTEPLHSLYRPPRQSWLEPVLVRVRESSGGVSQPANTRGLRALLKALRNGALVGILPDQVPRERFVFAPFFNQPAATMTLYGEMLRRTGADSVFLFCERLPFGRGFHLHLLPGDDPGLTDDDPVTAARTVNRGVERCVRLAPLQYQWTYRRFRLQPDGQPSPYSR